LTIHANDASYDQYISLLEYIYSDRVDFGKLESIETLARKFEVKRLIEYVDLIQRKTGKISESTLQNDFLNTLLPQNSIITELFSNVALEVQGQKINSHKVFLCARSEYFKAMFERDMIESKTNVMQVGQDITYPIEPEAVRSMLEFLYTDKLNVDVNAALALLPLATQYHLTRCKQICESIIEKEVDSESVAYVFQVARFYSATKLQHFCLTIISKEYDEVRKSDYWAQLTPEEIQEINRYLVHLKT